MTFQIISYQDLLNDNPDAIQQLEQALLNQGIVGVSHVPEFEAKTQRYILAARQFSALERSIKERYAPNRDAGQTEGYELGAEWFQMADGTWQKDDKKASYYAFIPDNSRNIWPQEVDLQTAYLALGELIFNTGKRLLKVIGLDEKIGLSHDQLVGYGRMLHYNKGEQATSNHSWCGAHFDHGIFTGLIPAFYFQDGIEVEEPADAGLYVVPTDKTEFVKVSAHKSVLLFQVGEFGQLISNDRIRATQHLVRKAPSGLERYTFALFYSAEDNFKIHSQSHLITDERYADNQFNDGSITYDRWQKASLARYRAL